MNFFQDILSGNTECLCQYQDCDMVANQTVLDDIGDTIHLCAEHYEMMMECMDEVFDELGLDLDLF